MRRYRGSAQFALNAASSSKDIMDALDAASVLQEARTRDTSQIEITSALRMGQHDAQSVARRMQDWGEGYNDFCYKRHSMTGRRL